MMRVAIIRSSSVGAAPEAGPVNLVNPAPLGNYPRLALLFGRGFQTNKHQQKTSSARCAEERAAAGIQRRTQEPKEPTTITTVLHILLITTVLHILLAKEWRSYTC